MAILGVLWSLWTDEIIVDTLVHEKLIRKMQIANANVFLCFIVALIGKFFIITRKDTKQIRNEIRAIVVIGKVLKN